MMPSAGGNQRSRRVRAAWLPTAMIASCGIENVTLCQNA
jgi:hypothetical protein